MPILSLDDFAAPLQWAAFDAADIPSAMVSITADSINYPHAADDDSMTVTVAAGAVGHVFRRTTAATDLADIAELAFWVRADQRIATDASAPVRLRLELGSTALPVGDAANMWHRYLSVPSANKWTYQRLALDDLAPSVRGALTEIVISVVASDIAVSVTFDGLEAHNRTLFADCEAALIDWLHNQLTIGADPVPATLAPDLPVDAALPHFSITRIKSVPNTMRALNSGSRSDFTDDGYRVRQAPQPWDIFYAIDCRAGTAAAIAEMQDFLSGRLVDGGWLRIGNRAWRTDIVDWQAVTPDRATVEPRLLLRIAGWQDSGSSLHVTPADTVVLNIGAKAAVEELV